LFIGLSYAATNVCSFHHICHGIHDPMARHAKPFDLVRLLAALADRTRLRIAQSHGWWDVCACYFVEILKQSQPKNNSGLVQNRQCAFRDNAVLETCIGLIWSDRVNTAQLWGCSVVFAFVRGQSEQQPRQILATIDQSDIRGPEPHNHDPSGAASDCYREPGRVGETAHMFTLCSIC